MSNILCIDVLNIIHRHFFINSANVQLVEEGNDDELFRGKTVTPKELVGATLSQTLSAVQAYVDKFKIDTVVFAFDNGKSWRKLYTSTEDCISGKPYKGNRRNNLTPEQKRMFDIMFAYAENFEELFREYTSVICLSRKHLEADDIIAGLCHRYADKHNIYIISTDKDLIQLLGYENVKLVNAAANNEFRTLDSWDGDYKYFIFEKCFRGDTGDNVCASYPRLRSTKIKQAYTDPYLFEQLMNHGWTDHRATTIKVRDLYQENILLMDLYKQPEHIKVMIDETLDECNEPQTKFNFMKFCKCLGKYGIKKASDNITRYTFLHKNASLRDEAS